MSHLYPFSCLKANTIFNILFTFCSISLAAQSTGSEISLPFSIYLEAECGMIGENWRTVSDSAASEGSYVVIRDGFISLDMPPEDVPANRVSFKVQLQEADEFYLWARTKSLSPASDSYWVRVNGGEWIKWSSGLRLRDEWNWRSVVNSPFALPAGEVNLEFAYRESDTRLDKLYLSTLRSSPQALGGPAINCDATTDCAANPESCKDEFWVEAECTEIGNRWKYTVNTLVSSSGYLEYVPPSSLSAPDGSDKEVLLSFSPIITTAGDYSLFLRMNAIDVGKNSFWVQVDEGQWIDFSTDTVGNVLATDGFEWRRLNDNGNQVVLSLTEGEHTIRIGGREANAQLDKLFLGMTTAAPSGFGKVQLNCFANNLTPNREADLPSLQLSVYPNPASESVTVSLPQLSGGPVWIDIVDGAGRLVSQQDYLRIGQSTVKEVSVADLPAGIYHLSVRTDSGRAARTFVKK